MRNKCYKIHTYVHTELKISVLFTYYIKIKLDEMYGHLADYRRLVKIDLGREKDQTSNKKNKINYVRILSAFIDSCTSEKSRVD